jgi:uncharacterized protein (TIGR03083 family)
MDHAQAYGRVHRRVCQLVDEQNATMDVPTCPGWTVKDVVAHLAGFFTAYRLGDPKEAFGPDWGDREVEERKSRSLQDCLSEWADLYESPGDLFSSHLAPVAVSDVLAHEQDIRNALNRPGARDDENIVPAVEMALSFDEQKVEAKGLPAFRVVTEDIDRQVGQGEPAVTLRTTTFDLFRALHGRRTEGQVRAMEWEGDPGPWMPVFFVFPPAESVVER